MEITLASLSDEHMLLSWSVFQDKSGQLSVKIRYEAANDAVNHRDDSHYHRKKPSQVQRDHQRTQAWRAKTRNHGKQTQLTQTDISARTPTPPGDVPAQHAGIMTRSTAKVVQLDTPEIQRGDLTQASSAIDLDITAVTLADKIYLYVHSDTGCEFGINYLWIYIFTLFNSCFLATLNLSLFVC